MYIINISRYAKAFKFYKSHIKPVIDHNDKKIQGYSTHLVQTVILPFWKYIQIYNRLALWLSKSYIVLVGVL